MKKITGELGFLDRDVLRQNDEIVKHFKTISDYFTLQFMKGIVTYFIMLPYIIYQTVFLL